MTTEVFATNIDAGGTDLRWDRYTPLSGTSWPAAVVLHAGRFKGGTRGPPDLSQDLADAGFLTFAAEYRLAPPHTTMNDAGPPGDGQQDPPSNGQYPQQTDDVQRVIRAARADSHCSGKVVVVGCSTGGAHGLWWAINGSNNDDRPDALVSLSGPHDLDNSDLLAVPLNLHDVENYTGHLVAEGTAFHNAAKAASPYWATIGTTPCPVLLFNSTSETIPQSIHDTAVTKMTSAGGTLESHLRTGTEHAGQYWYLGYSGAFSSVKDCSIDFLQRMLIITPPTVVSPAQIVLQRK